MQQVIRREWAVVPLVGVLLMLAAGISPASSFSYGQLSAASASSPYAVYLPDMERNARARDVGVYIPLIDATTWGSQVDSFNATTGVNHSMYLTGSGFDCYWVKNIPNILNYMNKAYALGAAPLVTWMPSDCANGGFGNVNHLGLPDVLAGSWDAYIKQWATDVSHLPYTVYVRWGHEMNIPSYSWAGQYGFGSTGKLTYANAFGHGCGVSDCFGDPNVLDGPERYVAAYRHVHDLAAPLAPNIQWVWNPNNRDWPLAQSAAWNQYNNYYPGDAYVDWISLDGYNWGDQSGNGNGYWITFDGLFGADLNDLALRHPTKPQMITEFASVEDPKDPNRKAAWILDAYQSAQKYPSLRVLNWVQDNRFYDSMHNPPQLADFRVDSSPAALQAYKDGVASWLAAAP